MLEVTWRRPEPRRGQGALRAAALVLGLLSAVGGPTPWAEGQAPIPREETPLPGQILPPLPPLPPGIPDVIRRPRVHVRQIRVEGGTVFSEADFARVVRPYLDRELSAEDLEEVRRALTLLYVEAGYVNSGAILPDQDVADGVVTFSVIEGGLTDIQVGGTRWFRPGYVSRRLGLGAGPPLNVNRLQRQIQLLLEDPRIRRLNAELKPGLRPGEGVLAVTLEEHPPYRLLLDFNNHQPPAVGAERGIVTLEHLNLTGWGDVLTLRYGRSEGLDPLLDFRYAVPVTARDTTVSFQYRRNAFAVIEELFRPLDIESESEVFTVAVRQPFYRTLNTEFAVAVIGERLSHDTRLLGQPFPLLPGASPRGETTVTAIRLAPEWVHRTQEQVLAVRSRFSFGIDALGSTINPGDVPDSRFFSWLGQFQWVRRLPFYNTALIFRTDLQLAADPLLTLEQIAVGGRYTVRGYRENSLVRDNAFLASLEGRVPIVQNVRWADFLELAPFVDYGRAWNTRGPTLDPPDLISAGLGLRWGVTLAVGPVRLRPQAEIYFGYPLRTVGASGNLQDGRRDIRDPGIHFQVVLGAF